LISKRERDANVYLTNVRCGIAVVGRRWVGSIATSRGWRNDDVTGHVTTPSCLAIVRRPVHAIKAIAYTCIILRRVYVGFQRLYAMWF